MKAIVKRSLFICLLLPALFAGARVQDTIELKAASYTKTITERADKIVAKLGIADNKKYESVRQIITQQYRDLNAIYTERDEQVKAAKENLRSDKTALDSALKNLESQVTQKLEKLHPQYLSSLGKKITQEQVDQVKDGMTYGVLPITYKGYQDMIPTLTAPQKAQILTWLTEARELAMDAESAEKKHAWFGKYKGRINNYLSAQGYDSKKEREEWEKRIKAAQAAKQKGETINQ
ncbi:MAG: DUF3826 domain-containing protein [Bacteroidota bacterium]